MDNPNPSVDHVRTRNKILILTFFSLIILLAVITGGCIISLAQKINSKPNPAIRNFCSPSLQSQSSCIALLSSQIQPPFNSDPNHIFLLSLESSHIKLSRIIPIFSADRACSSSLTHAARQLDRVLEIVRDDPDVQSYERGNMTAWIDGAAEDLTACASRLESTAVVEVRAVLEYSRDFLVDCETVNEFFRWGFAGERSPRDEIVENLITVSLFGSQYLVLLLLFSLLLRFFMK